MSRARGIKPSMDLYDRALFEAQKSTMRRKYVAILTDNKGRIVSIGHNHPRHHSSKLKSCLL